MSARRSNSPRWLAFMTCSYGVAELLRVRARVISLRALKADKSETRDDPLVAAKDRADVATLSRLG